MKIDKIAFTLSTFLNVDTFSDLSQTKKMFTACGEGKFIIKQTAENVFSVTKSCRDAIEEKLYCFRITKLTFVFVATRYFHLRCCHLSLVIRREVD